MTQQDSLALASGCPYSRLGAALASISQSTTDAGDSIAPSRKRHYAQYFTPMAVAHQMAEMLDLPNEAVIGDYGAGAGILGATVLGTSIASDAARNALGQYELQAYEIDDLLHGVFHDNLSRVEDLASDLWQPQPSVSLGGDFTAEADRIMSCAVKPCLDAAILNPPYQKLAQSSELARLLRRRATPTPNLYAAFVLLAVTMLRPGGQLVAIVPRSFCNGDYFAAFRRWMREQGAIDWFVRYERRSNVFRADNVLQENVIFRFRRGVSQSDSVRISLSDDPSQAPKVDTMVDQSDVLPDDDDRIYVPASAQELAALHGNRARPCTLADLGLTIATGKIEDFRYRDKLSAQWLGGDIAAPLVYAQHWQRGENRINWASEVAGKPACLERGDERTEKRLLPAGQYVVLKRISANDDRTGRCHPARVTPQCLPGEWWAFENHVQVIGPAGGTTVSADLAEGIRRFLASQEVDRALKTISGTTQINCNDIRRIRFPAREELIRLGSNERVDDVVRDEKGA